MDGQHAIDLGSMLEECSKKDSASKVVYICRKGEIEDVASAEIKEDVDEEVIHKSVVSANEHSSMTEQEFLREFGSPEDCSEPGTSGATADFYDIDPRSEVEADVIERKCQTVEESAGTLSSMRVFRGTGDDISGFRGMSGAEVELVVRLHLPDEDPRTIDVDVDMNGTRLTLFSHRYKMRCFMPTKVEQISCSLAKFYSDKHLLEIPLKVAGRSQ